MYAMTKVSMTYIHDVIYYMTSCMYVIETLVIAYIVSEIIA